LSGGAELAAWIWFARLLGHRGPAWAALVFGAFRVLRPLWSWLGTRIGRAFVAFALLAVSLLVQGFAAMSFAEGLGAVAAALPAVADLCASAAADAITVERRATAYSWIDMAQALGCCLGIALGSAEPRLAPLVCTAALLVGSLAIPDLRDRRTPRSTWPLGIRLRVFRAPLPGQLALLVAAGSGLGAAAAVRSTWGWWAVAPPLLGMAAAARVESGAPNALVVPRALFVLGGAALALRFVAPPAAAGIGLFVLGGFCSAGPSAVARGAGEMDRPVASSWAWSALALGAGLGLAWSAASW
jgi:hypothetical protein